MTRGYFGVGVYYPRTPENVGSLWRSADLYGAAFLATVKQRYTYQYSDTMHSTRHTPLHHYDDVDDLIAHLPRGCELVGIELDPRADELPQFAHPERAMYLLGAEDKGLPTAVADRCHHLVQIPAVRPMSMNVASAGAIVIYDRFAKQLARRPVEARP